MYHVGPIGLTALIIYLLSLYLTASGFVSRSVHRRLWNWVLFSTFLITALIGVFMALQVNYRWNVPIAKQLLHWHVEFGIGMACAAIIHLTWHLRYYFGNKAGKVSESEEGIAQEVYHDDNMITGLLLMITGFASSSAQFILLREAVILGGGTEASTGIFLWLWLMVSASGAIAGNASRNTDLRKMMWTLVSGLMLSLVCYLLMNSIILGPGEIPSFLKTLVIITLTVAPAAFISSFVFIRLTAIRQSAGGFVPGNSFGMETTGSVAAGILTTFSVSLFIANFQVYLIVIVATVTATLILLYTTGKMRNAAIICGLPLIALILILKPDVLIRSLLLKGVRVDKSIDTPYGNISTGSYGGEKTIFYDHRPLFFSGDIARTEENIHYALLQRTENDKVLIISGGIEKHLGQLMKYEVRKITYLEHDPGIIEAEKAADTTINTMALHVVKSDPLRYLKKNPDRYNAVIQLIPPPSTLSVNRFFTEEYFINVKKHLTADGVFMCTPMPFYNYSPESYRKGFSPVYNSLKATFKNIILIPGSLLYVIASDAPLSADISRLVTERGIENSYVNGDFLDDADIRRKSDLIMSQVDTIATLNSMMRPVSTWFNNSLSLEMRGVRGTALAVIAVLMIIPFLFIRRGGFMMFAASSGLAGYGMIIIFLLQVTVGNMYILTALILSLLMAGLAVGASTKFLMIKRPLIVVPLLLAVLYAVTGSAASALTRAAPALLLLIIFAALLTAGYLTGTIYRVLTSSSRDNVTGSIYASDLAGAALGYMIVSTLLVPLAGITAASFILTAFILISVALVSIVIKH